MATISATTYATPSTQALLGRAKLEAARREADQAESNAKTLRQEADQAEQEAQEGQSRVSSLRTQLAQTDSTYTNQIRRQAAASASKQVQTVLSPVTALADNGFTFPDNPLKAASKLWAGGTGGSGQLLNQVA